MEFAFGILNQRFSTLLHDIQKNEDSIVFFILACILLHYKCLDHSDYGDDLLVGDDTTIVVNTSATSAGKNKIAALLEFARRKKPTL